jgi:hypothetical protein
MKLTDKQKDFISAIAVGLINMILFLLLMGTMAVWGQNAGHKLRSKISSHVVEQPSVAPDSAPAATPDSL